MWDEVADRMEKFVSEDPTRSPVIVFQLNSGMVNNPKWKALVKQYGLYDLWVERGFPVGCQAVGDDDFSCQARLNAD